MIIPPVLKDGDRVAIISPASTVKPEYIDGAVEFLRAEGLEPVVSRHAKGPASGSYASDMESRLGDFCEAWRDPSVRAVLCARGGYGSVHLLPHIDLEMLRDDPKWLIGFSDISALHAMLSAAGVASIHGPMAKHLAEDDPEHYATRAMMRILREGLPVEYFAAPHPYNICGTAEGRLAGGNLAVINGLAATPYDVLNPDTPTILFIEDISEAIYAVERMLRRVIMSDAFRNIKGFVVGHFTEYRHPDANHPDMDTMISRLLKENGINNIPVAFGFPAGHTADNLPLVCGAQARLRITPEGVLLSNFEC